MSVTLFPGTKQAPDQALRTALDVADDMEMVAIVYIDKGQNQPKLTCSAMTPMDLHFMAYALQHYAVAHLDGEQ